MSFNETQLHSSHKIKHIKFITAYAFQNEMSKSEVLAFAIQKFFELKSDREREELNKIFSDMTDEQKKYPAQGYNRMPHHKDAVVPPVVDKKKKAGVTKK